MHWVSIPGSAKQMWAISSANYHKDLNYRQNADVKDKKSPTPGKYKVDFNSKS